MLMKIAVNKGGTGTSTSQSAAANLDCMLTFEDLCAVLKRGSSDSNVIPLKGTAEPLNLVSNC